MNNIIIFVDENFFYIKYPILSLKIRISYPLELEQLGKTLCIYLYFQPCIYVIT